MNFNSMTKAMIMQQIQSNPQARQAWSMVQQMKQGKSDEEKIAMIKNLAKEKGMSEQDLNNLAQQFGFKL